MNVLLVEDNPRDAHLVRRAFKRTERPVHVHVATDGVNALAFLRQEGAYAQAPRPHLILLDCHLPNKGGLEVLQEIKGDTNLKHIPVIMFTDSQAEEHVRRAYTLHVNAYIIKPVAFDNLLTMIETLEHFWFGVVTLPPV